MNWGRWIFVAFVLFAGFIATLVTVCVRQDVSLVSKEYYKEELAYQDQIVRIRNVSALAHKPEINVMQGTLVVSFGELSKVSSGEMKLFRPSDARLDRTFALTDSETDMLQFDVSSLPAGMYKARMTWQMNGKEYFIEEIVNL